MKFYLSVFAFLLLQLNSFAQNYWWNNKVAYEIFVRSFYDSNGDGRGDFNGITQKINYLNDGNPNTKNDLGIGLVWLMPINTSPSYHGYDVTDYKKVNPQYGSMNDFKSMLQTAHSAGIKVIIDLVINHTSSQHPWFIKSAANDPFFRNFYRWENTPPAQTGPWGQQVWYPKNGSNYYALFWSEMPDLNYNYKPVRDSILSIAKYWLKDIGVDGFRLDAVMYLYENGNTLKNTPETIAFLKELNDSCEVWKQESLLIGEVWDSPQSVALYTGVLDMCFDFNLAEKNIQSANTSNPYEAKLALNNAHQTLDTNQYGNFLTNHDQNRLIDVLGNDINKNKVAASLYLTQAGVPFIYYGEEVAMKGVKPDEDIRRPMQWSPAAKAGFTTGTPWRNINSNYTSFNVESLKADSNSIWNHYRKLIQLRNSDVVLQEGLLKNVLNTNASVHSYLRSFYNDDVLIIVNTSANHLSDVEFSFKTSAGTNIPLVYTDVWNDSTIDLNPSNGIYSFKQNLKPYQTYIYRNTLTIGKNEDRIQNISVYPNPSNTNFINIEGINFNTIKNISLVNSIGQIIDIRNKLQQGRIDIAELNSGLYYLIIKTTEGAYRAKFIKE
jgi:alpha-amylase